MTSSDPFDEVTDVIVDVGKDAKLTKSRGDLERITPYDRWSA
jgi:hypothetical protein